MREALHGHERGPAWASLVAPAGPAAWPAVVAERHDAARTPVLDHSLAAPSHPAIRPFLAQTSPPFFSKAAGEDEEEGEDR